MLTFKHYTVAVHDLDQAISDYEKRFGMAKVGEQAFNPIGRFNYQPMGYNGQVMCHLINPEYLPSVDRMCESHRDTPVVIDHFARIGVEDVVKGYTVNAAAGAWRDRDTGSLTAGKFADLIVLDRDIYAVDPEAIGDDVDDIAAASGIEAIVAVEDFPRDRHARRLAALR